MTWDFFRVELLKNIWLQLTWFFFREAPWFCSDFWWENLTFFQISTLNIFMLDATHFFSGKQTHVFKTRLVVADWLGETVRWVVAVPEKVYKIEVCKWMNISFCYEFEAVLFIETTILYGSIRLGSIRLGSMYSPYYRKFLEFPPCGKKVNFVTEFVILCESPDCILMV